MTRRRSGKIKLLVGTRLVTTDGFESSPIRPTGTPMGGLPDCSRQGNRKAKKATAISAFDDILATTEGQMLIVLSVRELAPAFSEAACDTGGSRAEARVSRWRAPPSRR